MSKGDNDVGTNFRREEISLETKKNLKPKNDDIEKERAQIRKDFALGTSCHGLSEIYSANHKGIRILWIVLVLVVLGVLIWQIVDRFQAYFRYDTQVQVSETFVNDLEFPAISICNYNRFFDVEGEERNALNTLSYVYDFGLQPDVTSINKLNNAIQFFEQLENDQQSFNLTSYLKSKSWKLDDDGVIQFCSVDGLDVCSAANFTPTISASFGQCWTLNTEELQQKRGISHGIHLILYVNQFGYTEDPLVGRIAAGIVFHVHPKHEPSRVKEVGQSVGVGLWGTVAMHKQQITNMYDPWGNCDPSKENLNFHPVYTVTACMDECFDRKLIERCGCRDPSVVGFSNFRECTSAEVFTCAGPGRSILETFISPEDCGCTQACSEVQYRTSISYSTFPNLVAASEFSFTFHNSSTSVADLRENIVGLTFYFDDLTVTTRVESKAITESALLSDIGGQLGLWIGISVITLCEFIQLTIKMLQTMNWRKKL